MRTEKTAGFTLIELMITVAIIGIIAAIAYPSYGRWVIETRRSEAQIALTQAAAQLEKFFTQCNTYTIQLTTGNIPACSGLGYPSDMTPNNSYRISIAAGGAGIATSYVITATAQSPQTNDTDCLNLTLNNVGIKSQSGPNTQGRCWRS